MALLIKKRSCLLILFLAFGLSEGEMAHAIVAHPTHAQLQEAIEKGKAAVQSKTPPSELYWRFGPSNTLQPHGFIMTKLGGLAVLAAHYAFRSASPTEQDMARITEESHLQISVTVFGAFPSFAVNSYILLKQADRLIKPAQIRSDARAHRSAVWPNDPPYQGKIIASFPYGSFDPLFSTTISVFPGNGGEIPFELDFSIIP